MSTWPGPPRERTRPRPLTTYSNCPPEWACQWVLAPAEKCTTVIPVPAGADSPGLSHTSPVNLAASPCSYAWSAFAVSIGVSTSSSGEPRYSGAVSRRRRLEGNVNRMISAMRRSCLVVGVAEHGDVLAGELDAEPPPLDAGQVPRQAEQGKRRGGTARSDRRSGEMPVHWSSKVARCQSRKDGPATPGPASVGRCLTSTMGGASRLPGADLAGVGPAGVWVSPDSVCRSAAVARVGAVPFHQRGTVPEPVRLALLAGQVDPAVGPQERLPWVGIGRGPREQPVQGRPAELGCRRKRQLQPPGGVAGVHQQLVTGHGGKPRGVGQPPRMPAPRGRRRAIEHPGQHGGKRAERRDQVRRCGVRPHPQVHRAQLPWAGGQVGGIPQRGLGEVRHSLRDGPLQVRDLPCPVPVDGCAEERLAIAGRLQHRPAVHAPMIACKAAAARRVRAPLEPLDEAPWVPGRGECLPDGPKLRDRYSDLRWYLEQLPPPPVPTLDALAAHWWRLR